MAGSVIQDEAPAEDENGDPIETEPVEPPKSKWDEDSPLEDFFEHVKLVSRNVEYIQFVTPKYAEAALAFTSAVDVVSGKEAEAKVNSLTAQSKNCVKQNKKTIDDMDKTL